MGNVQQKSHGGLRKGAGRKPGRGMYGESTQPMRIPESQVEAVRNFLVTCQERKILQSKLKLGDTVVSEILACNFDAPRQTIPAIYSSIPAGRPHSSDNDNVEKEVDLNEHLIRHKESTFLLRVSGWSMRDSGIFDGDELIVDRSIESTDGAVVVALVNNDLTVKRLRKSGGTVRLAADNPEFSDITFGEGEELVIWGVVTRVLHRV